MNNFNLMRAAGIRVHLWGMDGLFIAGATPLGEDASGSFLYTFENAPWGSCVLDPKLFTRLPRSARAAVAAHIAANSPTVAHEVDGAIRLMLDELERAPEGSQIDDALSEMTEGYAEVFESIAAGLKARAEAAELEAVMAQPIACSRPQSGRL